MKIAEKQRKKQKTKQQTNKQTKKTTKMAKINDSTFKFRAAI